MTDYLLFITGLGALLWGADRLVDAASGLARRLGVSALVTAVVVVGFGTSMPELLTSLDAALQGSSALAIANVIGSNIANILLVVGLSALCIPLRCEPGPMRRDIPSLILACVVTLFAMQMGTIGRWTGLVLTAGLLAYLATVLGAARIPETIIGHEERARDTPGVARSVVRSLFSIAVLCAGAHLLVSGALGIASRHGVSESAIGLSLVAVGTSLPELAVAALALVRRKAEVAIGNIVGSTLFNLLGILGITAMLSPLEVPDTIARFDVWIMLAAVLALAAFARTDWHISRGEGAVLLLGYPAYLAAVFA